VRQTIIRDDAREVDRVRDRLHSNVWAASGATRAAVAIGHPPSRLLVDPQRDQLFSQELIPSRQS
jgi:hypothetical protein